MSRFARKARRDAERRADDRVPEDADAVAIFDAVVLAETSAGRALRSQKRLKRGAPAVVAILGPRISTQAAAAELRALADELDGQPRT